MDGPLSRISRHDVQMAVHQQRPTPESAPASRAMTFPRPGAPDST